MFSIFQTFICYNDPASHPYISKEESDYLKAEMGQLKRNDDLPATPWKSILTSMPVIAYVIAQVKYIISSRNYLNLKKMFL